MFGESMLYRKNMLDEYSKQLAQWKQEGRDSKDFQFSAISSDLAITGDSYRDSLIQMMIWYDANNNFAELLSGISQREAVQLISCNVDIFLRIFDNYREGMNRIFGETLATPTSFDTEEFFQKALNGLFTCQINDKDINLFELMGPAARASFLAKLNAKMEEEYARYKEQN
jgi:hypothetical protein